MNENKTEKTPSDGGPAFPTTQYLNGISPTSHSVGMTLRDYFAAKAMQANLYHGNNLQNGDWRVNIALDSYMMADAMMRARKK